MAFTKFIYNLINWKNKSESLTTPLGASNLNKMDSAIKTIGDNLNTAYDELSESKLDKDTANTMISNVSYAESTGIFTITRLNGSSFTFDTKLEKIVTNWDYDKDTQKLILTLDDGTTQEVDLSALITQYEFADSDMISFTVGSNGSVSANVKDGSITEAKLQPNYLAEIKTNASNAETSAQNASDYADDASYDAKLAQSYAVGGSGIREGEDTDNAKYHAQRAKEEAEKVIDYVSGDFITQSEKGAVNGVAPLDGNALIPLEYIPEDISAKSLSEARMIGKASFDGSSDIALANIMGTAYASASGTDYVKKYTPIARIDVSDAAYSRCEGLLEFTNNGGHANGLLNFHVRSGSTISSSTIYLNWLHLQPLLYENSIIAVKVEDGIFDLYFQPQSTWANGEFTLINCTTPYKIELLSKQGYVDAVTSFKISSLSGYAARAKQLYIKQLTNENIDELLTSGTRFYAANGNSCTGNIYNNWVAFCLEVYQVAGTVICQEMTGSGGVTVKRLHSTSGWTDWVKIATVDDLSNYLHLTGGTLSGDLRVGNSNSEALREVRITNAKRSVDLQVNSNGMLYLWDLTNNKGILSSALDGTNKFLGNADTATKASKDASGYDIAGSYARRYIVPMSQGSSESFEVVAGSVIVASAGSATGGTTAYLMIAHVLSEGVLSEIYKSNANIALSLSLSGSTLTISCGSTMGATVTILCR